MDERFTVFVDRSCPVCSREATWLARRDTLGRLELVDISHPGFDAERETGAPQLDLMRRIHGRTMDGRIVVGVEVFRRIYACLGFTRWARISRLPVVRTLLAAGYEVFALARFRWASTCVVSAPSLPPPNKNPQEKVQVS